MRRKWLFLLQAIFPCASARVPNAWLDWPEACSHVRSVDVKNSNSSEERLIVALAAGGSTASEALRRGADRLRAELSNRNVLCDAASPCQVTSHEIGDSHIIRACVPEGAPALKARRIGFHITRAAKKFLVGTANAAWIAGTTSLIMVMPLVFEIDREQQSMEMEQGGVYMPK